ncbi:hypothetical protein GQ43DRAFT_82824 [Delitschia confertaspora ATCC 74209]|uniref:RanBD1 domain-containing protein n=1 Tax=Delitschia confertaspora ATCC 74209 TaxID=1513339 RepID=A0A9P4JL30_9PLEO|nr:hypothetical protein GQ43DRAFT_82824 [Delitschia confertaspora ATCC 74209]
MMRTHSSGSVQDDRTTQKKSSKPSQEPSPTRSDRSTESEGRPVREKLKETRIDAQTFDTVGKPDHLMSDVAPNTNGSANAGSDTERGRGLRRKRSHEEVEDEEGTEKAPEKIVKHNKHTRKRSRDVTNSDSGSSDVTNPIGQSKVAKIDEEDGETPLNLTEPQGGAVPRSSSPKNKRSREGPEGLGASDKNTDPQESVTTEERESKRQRDEKDTKTVAGKESQTKIPAGSGFANFSSASPFASVSPKKPSVPATTSKAENELPQTSADKFKASGFGSFASSASPFGGLGRSTSKSPFAAAGGSSKPSLSSFASPSSSAGASGSGFGALGSDKSAIGNSGASSFGGAKPMLGGGFGGGFGSSTGFGSLTGGKGGLSSFASPGTSGITGLNNKQVKPFGAAADDEGDEDGGEEGNDDGSKSPTAEDAEKERQNSDQDRRFREQEIETGEENEETIWTGRAKLYAFDKAWQERGIGALKLNVTKSGPKKARFVLRADGTHRLILNTPILKDTQYGGSEAGPPVDGAFFLPVPKEDGSGLIQTGRFKMKGPNAVALYNEVLRLKKEL